MALQRLDKTIGDSGGASRSEIRLLIKTGRVRVNGAVASRGDEKIDPEQSEIRLDGKLLNCSTFKYIMMNKPLGVVSATEDRDEKTVLELLSPELKRCGLFPVGRLDKDTEGLLLLTNDGDFCHAITAPSRSIVKHYEFICQGELNSEDVSEFSKGLVLKDGTICLPAGLSYDQEDKSHGWVELSQGKYHQVKRMLASRGKPVLSLKRLSIGELKLDQSLAEGEFRELSAEEKERLFNNKLQ